MEPLLPPPGTTRGKGGRPEKHPRRLILDAIFYLVRGGIAWARNCPVRPPHQTVYGIFGRWAKAGAWQRVHDALRDLVRVHAGRDPLPTAAIVDSQTVRGADTVPATSAGYDAGKKTKGRKRHIAVDTLGLIWAVVVHGAYWQDQDGACFVLQKLRNLGRLQVVFADSAYSRNGLAEWVKEFFGWVLQTVLRPVKAKGFVVLPKRWIVERTFAWLVRYRRHSRDYERNPATSEAMIRISMIALMSRRIARQNSI